MSNFLKLRVSGRAFELAFAIVVGWLLMSAVTAVVLAALLLSIQNAAWSIVLGASVLAGWVVLATITYRSFLSFPARVGPHV